MTAGSPPSLQDLTSFEATVGYKLHQTILEIWHRDTPRPVARLAKTGPLLRPAAYELCTGQGLTEVTAHVTPSGAQTPDGTLIGIVNLSGERQADDFIQPLSGTRHSDVVHNPAQWRIVQAGLPPLTGEAVGSTQLHHNRLTDFLDRNDQGDRGRRPPRPQTGLRLPDRTGRAEHVDPARRAGGHGRPVPAPSPGPQARRTADLTVEKYSRQTCPEV
ncbi:hypothetical protein GCM10029978_063760 [Actinoallomurus acanthiterrae]